MSAKYALKYPVSFTKDGRAETLNEVSIRRMRLKDERDIAKIVHGADIAAALICRLCDIDAAVADQLDSEDANAIGEIISAFQTSGQATGAA
jgi:hypothetical protein